MVWEEDTSDKLTGRKPQTQDAIDLVAENAIVESHADGHIGTNTCNLNNGFDFNAGIRGPIVILDTEFVALIGLGLFTAERIYRGGLF